MLGVEAPLGPMMNWMSRPGGMEVASYKGLKGILGNEIRFKINNPQSIMFHTSMQGEVRTALSPYVAVAPNKHSCSWTPGIYEKIERVCRRRNMPRIARSALS